jgi:hypothetical protein
MRKKPLLAFDELERVHDWCEKLLGRQQYAVGDEGKYHASASKTIAKCENLGVAVVGVICDLLH